jgi:4-diphosphocytidyl-2-C-methyl-D-erythritol kinase
MLAPAKVNLYLHVLGRRADGYHLLDSLVVFAGIGDELTVRPSPAMELEIAGPFAAGLATGTSNLVMKAAMALKDRGRVREGAAIRLTKNLPLASGIGGGSSDAACCLRQLCDLWGVDVDAGELGGIALALGADVPVCLSGRASFLGGIGEEITPAGPLPPAWLVLANPLVATPTASVFGARAGAISPPARWSSPPATLGALLAHLEAAHNDLTDAATGVTPIIAEVLAALRSLPECRLARLSGSGATCFALIESEAAANAAARRLQGERPAWWIRAAPILP